MPDWTIGLIAAIVIAIGSLLAYTKQLPFGKDYEVSATFSSAHTIRPSSPVRIAGVDVGEVTEVEHLAGDEELAEQLGAEGDEGSQAAIVTMKLDEEAAKLRDDARFRLRPRLFLEGNYFIDVRPGTPQGTRVGSGHSFPLNQTSQSVHLDRVTKVLQSDVRADLQSFLAEFGRALVEHGGAAGWRELYRSSPAANRYTAKFNQAFVGTQPGDLSGMISGLQRVVRGLGRNQRALGGLITNLRTFSGAFAAEDAALAEAIERLPATLEAADPAFENLNASFPALRAFAREALPGTRSTPEALRAATPFVAELRRLMSERELRGLVRELRPTVPHLARLAQGNIKFFQQSRALSSCFNEVIIPWSHDTVKPEDPLGVYPHTPGGRTFEQTAYGLAGINSENRSGDANAHYIRVMGGSGQNLVRVPSMDGVREDVFALTPFPLLGAMPRIRDSAKPRYRPEEPCEEQVPPDLGAGIDAPPPQEEVPQSAVGLDALSGPGAAKLRSYAGLLNRLGGLEDLLAAGKRREAKRLLGRGEEALVRLGLTDSLEALRGYRAGIGGGG